jgi:hypothetical protein
MRYFEKRVLLGKYLLLAILDDEIMGELQECTIMHLYIKKPLRQK